MNFHKRDISHDKSRVWAEISRSALLNKVEVNRSRKAPGTEMTAVVKAADYGNEAKWLKTPTSSS